MKTALPQILLIEPNPKDARLVQAALAQASASLFEVTLVKSLTRGLGRLKKNPVGVILLDVSLLDGPSPEALNRLRAIAPQTPILLLTGSEDEVQAIDRGTQDYLVKDQLSSSLLVLAIHYALERKKAEKALAESERRFHELFENASLAIFQTVPDGKILATNAEFIRLFGYGSLDEFLSRVKNAADVFADPARRAEIIRLTKENPERKSYESLYRRKDGSTFIGDLKVKVVTDLDGQVLYLEGFIEDITERSQAGEEIRRRAAELTALNTLGRQINQSLSLEQVITDTVRETFRAVEPDIAFLFLREDEQLILKGFAPSMNEDLFDGVPEHRVGECMCGLAVREGIPLYSKDIFSDVRCTWVECKKAGLRSFAALPLKNGDEVIGVIGLAMRNERDFEKQASFLETLASQVSIGIRNARLYEAVQQELAERKRAEEATRTSEMRMRKLIETSPDAIWVTDTDGRIIMATPQTAALHGNQDAQELIGEDFLDLIAPEDRERALNNNQAILETGMIRNAEYSFIRKDGRRLLAELSISVIRDVQGKPESFIAVSRDISERKQAETALRESEERYRLLVELSPDAICVYQDDKIIFANPAAVKLLGASAPEELIGKVVIDFVHPEYRSMVLERTRHQIVERKIVPLAEEKFIRLDGSVIEVDVIAAPIRSQNAISVMVIFRDITERKRAERALQESQQMLRTVLDTIPVRVFWKDRNSTFLGCNRPFALDAGLQSPEEIPGKNDFQMAWAEQAELYRADDRVVMETGTAKVDYEEAQTTPDGATRWLRTGKIPLLDVDGQIIGLLGSYEDITGRKRVEQEVAHRLAELEAVNRISTVLRGSQTLDEMLPRLLDETLEMLETEAGEILLYDSSGDRLWLSVSRGWFTQTGEINIASGEGIAGHVFQTGEPYFSPEYALDTYVHKSTLPHIPAGWGGICVPIRAERETIGVLFVSVRLPRQLKEEDAHLLTTVSEIAGSAIRRVALHEQTMRQLQHLDALRSIDTAISSMFDLRLTLGILLDHITSQLVVDAADILLFNPLTHILEFTAGRGFRTSGIERSHLRLGEGYAGRAALERTRFNIPDLSAQGNGFLRLPLLEGEAFIAYYGVPLVTKGQVKGVLEIFHRAVLNPDVEWLDFLETLAGQAAIAIDNASLFESLQHSNMELATAYDATIEGWSRALDLRDRETEGHTQRVTEMTIRLAQAMNMSEDELVHLRRGTLLHDIGKMGVPDEILHKPGPLTGEERKVMRQHPQFAFEMLSPIAYLRQAIDIPYYHHEKWDGSGYPGGLKGEQIPYAARIFSVVDVFDALTSDRPYRKAWTRRAALEYIRGRAGKQFDPQVVRVFLDLQDRHSA
jgi:PAS domain S-box-containing protein